MAHLLCTAVMMDNRPMYYTKPEPSRTPNQPRPQRIPKPKPLHTFTIKGTKIQATSKKDAIKRYLHQNKTKR